MSTKDEKGFAIIIVNSIPPYCYELNNILALPDNFIYRFRFRKSKKGEWMPEIDNPKKLMSCDALIVLREFQTTAEFIPIRKIRITKVSVIGDIIYLEYKLKQKIPFSSNPEHRDAQLKKFNERLVPDIRTDLYPNEPGTDLRNLVFFGADYTYDFADKDYQGEKEDEDSNRWGNIIELIGKFKIYEDIDFIKITELRDERGKPTRVLDQESGAILQVKNRTAYNLEFLQRTFTHRSGTSSVIRPRDISMTPGSVDITPIISRQSVLGKYDLLHFSFRPEATSVTRKDSFLMIEFEHKQDILVLPAILVPIRIKPSLLEVSLVFASAIIFALSVVAYWFADTIVTSTSAQSFRNVLLPIMILSGGGLLRNIRDFILGRIIL